MANPEDIGYSSRGQWSCAECPAFGDCVAATELDMCLVDWAIGEFEKTGDFEDYIHAVFDAYEENKFRMDEPEYEETRTSSVVPVIIRRLALAGLIGLSTYGALWMKNNGIHPLDLLNPVPITHQVLAAPALLPTIFSESPLTCKPEGLINSQGDSKYEGIYFFQGELNSSPRRQVTTAHYYSYEEGAGTIIGNGEPFDPMAHTAASWFYPFDTWVKVSRVDNPNVYVLVRINDRGPDRVHHPEVGIDLAEGAMRALDPNAGSLEVIVEPVDCPIR